MAYSDFTIERIQDEFGVFERRINLFPSISSLAPSAWLLQTLEIAQNTTIINEKARSERLISPLLLELAQRNAYKFSLLSGENLNGSVEKGLNGECDFIISREPGILIVRAPIIAIVEAKKEDFDAGLAQCAAQLIGARMFNERKGTTTPVLYGAVTIGTDWMLVRLENNELLIHQHLFQLSNLPELLGALQAMIDFYFPKE